MFRGLGLHPAGLSEAVNAGAVSSSPWALQHSASPTHALASLGTVLVALEPSWGISQICTCVAAVPWESRGALTWGVLINGNKVRITH